MPVRPSGSSTRLGEVARSVNQSVVGARQGYSIASHSRRRGRLAPNDGQYDYDVSLDDKWHGAAPKPKARVSTDDAELQDISSQQNRLSRATRFGMAGAGSSAPVMLPTVWNRTVNGMHVRERKGATKEDYRLKKEDKPLYDMTAGRMGLLHLSTASPRRYAALRSVLRQIRVRLGPDEEHLQGTPLQSEWLPSRVVEYSCGPGEGAWASAEMFGMEADRQDRQLAYEGIDNRVALLRAGDTLLGRAREMAQTATAEGARRDIVADEQKEADPIKAEGEWWRTPDTQLTKDLVKVLAKMDVILHTPEDSTVAKEQRRAKASKDPDVVEEKSTLLVCNHTLSNMTSDAARSTFVRELWAKHPAAEVIAFVEEASQRGFACIASAREELLGIGSRSEALSQGPLAMAAEQTECHVVAPCPHDRPCPLLHDFAFADGTMRAKDDTNDDKFPTSRKERLLPVQTSRLFHGKRSKLAICATPLRLHVPSYAQAARGLTDSEENVDMCYLVVRRGPRPDVGEMVRQLAATRAESGRLRSEIQERAARTKEGILAQLRKGARAGETSAVAETFEFAEGEGRMTLDAAIAGTMADLEKHSGGSSSDARDELMRMLPNLLREQAAHSGATDADVPEAMRMAQQVFEQSAGMAEQQGETTVSDEDAADSMRLSAALLEQQNALRQQAEDEANEADEAPDSNQGLGVEEIESMRAESYSWPRLIQAPQKRGGHIGFDVCSAEGAIVRFIVAKSAGKQPYQDARKSFHGMLLPYMPFIDVAAPAAVSAASDGSLAVDDDALDATVSVQAIKTVMARIPAASLTERNPLPAILKTPSVTQRKSNDKKRSKTNILAEQHWPVSSARAIGADLVARPYDSALAHAHTSDARAVASGAGGEVKHTQFARRGHYDSDDARGVEQLRASGVYRKRDSRKKSLVDFGDDAVLGWNAAEVEYAAGESGENEAGDVEVGEVSDDGDVSVSDGDLDAFDGKLPTSDERV